MDLFITNDEAISLNRTFSETSRIKNIHQTTTLSSSISTTMIDGYRQGVEITSQKHFDAGLVKIHAGEVGHVMNRDYIGDTFVFRDSDVFYKEIDLFTKEKYIQSQDNLDALNIFFTDHTWPIVTSDCDLATLYQFDGIIEPLIIRDCITFKSLETLGNVFHSIKGQTLPGNIDLNNRTSDVVSCDYFNHNNLNPFVDSSDFVVNLETNDALYVNTSVVNLKPFEDIEIRKNIPFTNINDAEIANVLNVDSTSSYYTNNDYVKYNQTTAATGFVYDSVSGIGTDSLAFGGRIY